MTHGVLGQAPADAVRVALDRHQAAIRYDGPPVLLHGDLHPRHIFASDSELTGIIDWGDISAGDPIFDLGRYSIGGEDTLPDLLAGYGLEMTAELAVRFTAYRLVRMARVLYERLHHERLPAGRCPCRRHRHGA